MRQTVKKYKSFTDCNDSIGSFIQDHSENVLKSNPYYNLALSGGRTPVKLYKTLSKTPFDKSIQWQKVRFFWSDERFVPQSDENSNVFAAQRYLFPNIRVYDSHIFFPPTDQASCFAASVKYQQNILQAFNVEETDSHGNIQYPRFDLIMLGMGTDGHTASLFPEHMALDHTNLVSAVESEYAKPAIPRLTFTLPLLNSADTVIFVISGQEKITLFKSMNHDDFSNRSVPASMVLPRNELIWCLVEE